MENKKYYFGNYKIKYCKVLLNSHCNLHFFKVFKFYFVWVLLWQWRWSCSITRRCTEHKYTCNLLLKARILSSVLRHSKTFSLRLKITTFTNISCGRGAKSTVAETLMKYAAHPTRHHNNTEKERPVIGFTLCHQWNNAGTWFHLIPRHTAPAPKSGNLHWLTSLKASFCQVTNFYTLFIK